MVTETIKQEDIEPFRSDNIRRIKDGITYEAIWAFLFLWENDQLFFNNMFKIGNRDNTNKDIYPVTRW